MADIVTQTYDRLFGGEPNLSLTERSISIMAGLGLAAAAAKPRPNPLLNVLALAGGAYLALRGASGRCPLKARMAAGSDRPPAPRAVGRDRTDGPDRTVPPPSPERQQTGLGLS